MGRHDPGTPPDVTPKVREGYIIQERSYKLITPLFGGGVEPQNYDPVTVIRATSIRGHLRFWWRATRGGQYTTVEDLKKAEDALWGAASNDKGGGPSKVEVVVRGAVEGKRDEPFQIVKNKRGQPDSKPRSGSKVPAYAAFPLQPRREEVAFGMKMQAVQMDVAFTLTITYPVHQRAEVEATLWAWETFGGIGGRTRRGFGALELMQVDGIAPHDRPQAHRDAIEQWLRQQLNSYTTGGILAMEWPQLATDTLLVVTQPQNSPLICWNILIEKLRQFRSSQLNNWPDADSVRRIANQSYKGKSAIPTGRTVFPRAVFGLPIIFHFIGKGDPDDATLQGVAHDRLSSPLILRPLACAGGRYVGLALVLNAPRTPPDGLKLKGYTPNDPPIIKLTDEEAKPIQSLNGTTDVLRAFLDYLERE